MSSRTRLVSAGFSAPAITIVVAVLLLTIGGCGGCTQSASTRWADAERRAERVPTGAFSSTALFENVVTTLNHLDRDINLDLRPPIVILDATKSKDRKDVMATLGENPHNPTGRFDYLNVPRQNGGFTELGVRPGDRVRYFVSDRALAAQVIVFQSARFRQLFASGEHVDERLLQSWVDEEVRNLGEARLHYFELSVRRVVGESALLVEEGFPVQVATPERLEVWRYADDKIKAIARRFRRYVRGREGVLGWEPSPDEAVLKQVVKRLNQWIRRGKPTGPWQVDPLVEGLPDDIRKEAAPESLAALSFRPYDGRLLQEAVWLRDIARWARGEKLDEVARATQLFDWTMRNIQLEPSGRCHNRPWQTLLYGRGTAEERAWVFILLCRQEGLDAVMLAHADPKDPSRRVDWLPAVLVGGELSLFDCRLAVPIPGPGGQGVATLSQVAEDDRLLRQLDLDPEHPYPVTASELDEVTVRIAACPVALSKRMRLLESRLAGDQRLVLTTGPSAIAEKLRRCDRIAAVELWELPYRTTASQLSRDRKARRAAADAFQVFAWQPALWKARVLHFQGTFDGDEGAKTYYRKARPSDLQIEAMEKTATSQTVRIVRIGKMAASYWLGLLTYDSGQTDVAIDYLDRRTIQASPNGPWTDGARYNLARAYEVAGQLDKARAIYLADQSPQSHGNRLRARWLEPVAEAEAAGD